MTMTRKEIEQRAACWLLEHKHCACYQCLDKTTRIWGTARWETLEETAKIPGRWSIFPSCNKDGTPCDHQRMAKRIADEIGELMENMGDTVTNK
jgi:hypothetical protein